MKRIAIVQSNYLPWKGYFDLIAAVDEFVLLDDAQYTKRDWRNRNRIKTEQGLKWLTIPVEVKGRYRQRIDETMIADPGWARSHWESISQAYREAPYFDELAPRLEPLFSGRDEERLSDVNRRLLEELSSVLGIETKLSWSTDYSPSGAKSDRLVGLCVAAGADTYVSGPSARDYLDEGMFADAGVDVEWLDYSGYPEYPQLHGAFEHGVSVLDLMLNTGPSARAYMQAGSGTGPPDADGAHQPIIRDVERYYTGKVAEHGPTPSGVDWSSELPALRFEQLLTLHRAEGPFSIVDYGCGYGALAEVLGRPAAFDYRGFDISAAMMAAGRRANRRGPPLLLRLVGRDRSRRLHRRQRRSST